MAFLAEARPFRTCDNRLIGASDQHSGLTTYAYDAVGNLRNCTLPNGVNSFHQYDALNRLTNLNVWRGSGTIANYAYTVNPSGHRSSAVETLIRNPLNPQPFTISRLYHYDPTYRLTNETLTWGSAGAPPAPASASLAYSYDAVGNRLNLLSTLGEISSASYGYDFNDRLLSDTYDANGNTLTAPGFGMAQPDRYDFENRLLQRTVAGKTVSIVYDGDGNCVRKTVATATNTVTTLYLVDTVNPTGYAQVLEELRTTDNGPLTLDRTYAFGHTLLSQWHPAEAVVRYHGLDGHGNTRFLTDWQGDLTDTYDYDAFGNLIAATGSTPNNFLFTSEQFDPDLGLYFLRARYQDTTTGRFWTMDDFEGTGADPNSLHKYLYVHNNPINRIDPSGRLSLSEVRVGVILAVTTIGAIVAHNYLKTGPEKLYLDFSGFDVSRVRLVGDQPAANAAVEIRVFELVKAEFARANRIVERGRNGAKATVFFSPETSITRHEDDTLEGITWGTHHIVLLTRVYLGSFEVDEFQNLFLSNDELARAIAAITIHEGGHAFRLGHSSNRSSVMNEGFGDGSGIQSVRDGLRSPNMSFSAEELTKLRGH